MEFPPRFLREAGFLSMPASVTGLISATRFSWSFRVIFRNGQVLIPGQTLDRKMHSVRLTGPCKALITSAR